VAKIGTRLVVGHMVCLILGLGSCEPRIPVTVSADSVAAESPDPEPDDPAAAGRLKDCAPGTADCDRDHSNGCEAVLADDPKNCGICGTQCDSPHTESGCMGGTCRVIHCAPGYCDDDGDSENGCEVAEKTCHPVPALKN
jgi:hypothetical protein